MKTILATTMLLLCAGTAMAQPAPIPPPAAAAAPPVTPREPPSNDQTGLSVDRYVGYADRAIPHVTHDVMWKRTILSGGDPTVPGEPRAVMPYHKEVALVELAAHNVTSMFQVPEQLVFYVETGEGQIDDGKQVWDIKPGVAMLIPPNQAHRFSNTGAAPMKLLMTSQVLDSGVTPRADILVRDVDKLAFTERNVHWSNMTKYVFLPEDGLHSADRVYVVYMSGGTIAGPHAHTPGQEEVWIKLTDGPALMQMGSEIRPWPQNAGFMAPPNGQTVHAAINISNDTQAWFYMGRLGINQPAVAPPNPNRRPRPPAIVEGVERATIAGRPLSTAKPRR
jgi:mannose-6-phosphate isomerase-like protein (cupin superfamily)